MSNNREGLKPNELYNVEGVIKHQIFLIRRFHLVPFEDLYNAGYVGYLKAQEAFKPEYIQMTLKYADNYIKTEIWKELKKEWKHQNELCDVKGEDDPTYGGQYLDNMAAPDLTNPTSDERVTLIASLLHKLTRDESFIIRNTHFIDRPKRLKDLSKALGYSKQRVHQIKREGLEKLKVLLGDKA